MIKSLPATHLRSNQYDWYEHIPRLVSEHNLQIQKLPIQQQNGKIRALQPERDLNYFPIPTEIATKSKSA